MTVEVPVEVDSSKATLDQRMPKQVEDRSHMGRGKQLLGQILCPLQIRRVTGVAAVRHQSLPLNVRFYKGQMLTLETGRGFWKCFPGCRPLFLQESENS